ncbi:hypothetical protein EV702DRAFT_1053129, partial [Suillus placidus]
MVFDAQRFSKFDGKTFVHFVDEPFTADAFWNVQSQLPPSSKPLAFVLYADKTRLSSFGTAKGYPVVACLANLPVDICNGQGVKEDRDHAGKPSWVNFKNTTMRNICLVPHDKLLNILKCYPPRTSTHLQEVLKAAWAKATAEEKEEKLKEYGLCDVINAFSAMMYTDVHDALSWDRLHFNVGLHHDDLWAKLQKIIVGLGRAKVAQMDKNYEAFPHWRNLKHLAQVMNISFADGSVYEDISKMVVYAAHEILMEDDCPLGYLLLRCICLFLKLDAYTALEVHTTETISAGRHVVQAFSTYLQQYIDKSADKSDKNWNFPKLHMCVHIFDNIEVKDPLHKPLADSDDLEDSGDVDDLVSLDDADSPHVKLGSRQAVQTFELIEDTHKEDAAFTHFWLFNSLYQVEIKQITKCHFLKVNYESMVDWRQRTDYLRCSPKFFNTARFDCVFIQTKDKVIFGHLLFLFECVVGDITLSLALIHPFDAPT